ncbi:hypothetical protein SLEP1_g55631 [Rubroshorea leprosula]|uniref:Uncharacterized protein n=1 Tax=Rubroshorea leprosula TaxID=152421 RepID=A0AAV5MH33_9ROSI|nr:hypothetical protein SLEP1_g55631 [Rubroshorea leprosula]
METLFPRVDGSNEGNWCNKLKLLGFSWERVERGLGGEGETRSSLFFDELHVAVPLLPLYCSFDTTTPTEIGRKDILVHNLEMGGMKKMPEEWEILILN